jgi:hypothetical protein
MNFIREGWKSAVLYLFDLSYQNDDGCDRALVLCLESQQGDLPEGDRFLSSHFFPERPVLTVNPAVPIGSAISLFISTIVLIKCIILGLGRRTIDILMTSGGERMALAAAVYNGTITLVILYDSHL